MTTASAGPVDIPAVRAAHPIHEIVAAAGIELTPRGHGFVGCCPFHDDSTPSLSVGGVPDRFHCFGCGASGDVIDFVRRLEDLGFREAIQRLDGTPTVAVSKPAARAPAGPDRWPMVSAERGYAINNLAWEYCCATVAHAFAVSYLRHHRGIDVRDLEAQVGQPLVGYTGQHWAGMTGHLLGRGVSADELLAMDLSRRSKTGRLADTFHGRLVVPVRSPSGQITGLLGRTTLTDARTPKYRNPTRTATFDKSTALYSPTPTTAGATAVVVEGPLDALAVAATAATSGRLAEFWPCTANGVSVSPGAGAPGHHQRRRQGRGCPRWGRRRRRGHPAVDRCRMPWATAAGDAHLPAGRVGSNRLACPARRAWVDRLRPGGHLRRPAPSTPRTRARARRSDRGKRPRARHHPRPRARPHGPAGQRRPGPGRAGRRRDDPSGVQPQEHLHRDPAAGRCRRRSATARRGCPRSLRLDAPAADRSLGLEASRAAYR